MASAPPTLMLSPEDQRAQLWSRLVCHNSDLNNADDIDDGATGCPKERDWPSYDAVISHVATADYKQNIKCPHDHISDKSKMICPHGVICCAKMELFDYPYDDDDDDNNNHKSSKAYSGLFQPGTTVENCILRLSTAIRPLDQGIQAPWARAVMKTAVGSKLRNAKLVPGAALKCFRSNGIPSGNLLLLGSKVGQREEDYFAHCQSTQMTEKMPALAMPFVKKFSQYSDYPLSLGLSDFCAHDSNGTGAGAHLHFPYSIVFQPLIEGSHYKTTKEAAPPQLQLDAKGKPIKEKYNFQTFDSFLDEATHIPIGTPVFDVYAVPDPEAVGDPTRLERIGRITTTSSMIQSAPTDGLAFRHQIKEDDFMMRPEWKDGIQRKIKHGKLKGTVGKLAGWRLYEEDIA
eukprot:CAMPEP_0201938774 /NCGR_PEP_ID=MMETSP0903-20130614/41952_1 /ASSEMBLY_ACC=CAM_ASM_000552 /TAXON_ID=420261 /ORGANISM="Thalassiosira antarctica, Strain CCMP982" /LENGTH=401 /DNA_ID=CAMNT_0048480117 /DNA_START=32 /DNA_END=1233 /DNA_ORIENTATION=+